MEQTANYPIQMISVTSTLGDMTPLKFRYENEAHELITVKVDDVCARKELSLGFGGSIIYTCASSLDEQRILYELRYEVGSHKWIFGGRLN